MEDISFRTLLGGRTAAYRVLPPGTNRTAGALFVHWYDSESMTSNRTQFLNEAVELAPAWSGIATGCDTVVQSEVLS